MSIVTMNNITVQYDKDVIIPDLSLEVQRGENLAIVGPSSCGKTTLMRALCGFIKITRGEVILNGSVVSSPARHVMIPPEKRKIGVVFQDYAVWPHLTVIENIIYPLRKQKLPKDEAKKRAFTALAQVKMSDYATRLPSQLSGGQQQRVALARALVSSAELIVLDEPITNLDATLREEMAYEIRNLQQSIGVTVIYITHDQETAMTISDRMVIMNKTGSIRQIGTPEDIWNHPRDRGIYTFLGVSNFLPVSMEGKSLRLVSGEPDQQMPLGKLEVPSGTKKFLLAARPMEIRLHPYGPTHSPGLKGRVKRVTYLGNQFDYIVDVEGQEIRVQEDSLDAFTNGVPEENSYRRLEFLNPSLYPDDRDQTETPIFTSESKIHISGETL